MQIRLLLVAALPWLVQSVPANTINNIANVERIGQPMDVRIEGPVNATDTINTNSTYIVDANTAVLQSGIIHNVSENFKSSTQAMESNSDILLTDNGTQSMPRSDDFLQATNARGENVVVKSVEMVQYTTMLGWLCFVLWSLSFYPQIIENMRRRSVTGLNIDGVVYNLTGFLSYALFNVGMFYSETVQRQYFTVHQEGALPVTVSDVAFAVHASIMTGVVLMQVYYYRTPDQTLSYTAKVFNGGMWASALVLLLAVRMDLMTILSYLQAFSSLKLMLTVVKYIPQVIFNFKRRSTAGFSVGTQLFDIFGGVASMLQMFLQANNTNDWSGLTGNPTKTGLALVSIGFDLVLIIQHYYYTYCYTQKQQSEDAMPIMPRKSTDKKPKYGTLDVPVSNLTEVVHHTTEFCSFDNSRR